MPIQGLGGKGIKATIEIYPEFAAGLKDLDGFSHIILLYHYAFGRKTCFDCQTIYWMMKARHIRDPLSCQAESDWDDYRAAN